MIAEILIGIVALVISIIAHELGHAYTLKKFTGREVEIKFSFNPKELIVGNEKDYENLTFKQYRDVILNGIVIGLIPLLFYWLSLPNVNFIFYILIVSYLLGCIHDFKLLWGLKKNG